MGTRTETITTSDGDGNEKTRTVTWTTTPEQDNDQTLRAAALAALAANRTYLNRQSPTQQQTVSQVAALTQAMNGLIRLFLGLLDGTD